MRWLHGGTIGVLAAVAACSSSGGDSASGDAGAVAGSSAAGKAGAAQAGAAGASSGGGGGAGHAGTPVAGFTGGPGGAAGTGGTAGAAGTAGSAAGAAGVSGGGAAGAPSAGAGGGAGAAGTGGSSAGGAGGAPWTQPPLPATCQKNARILTYDPVGHGRLLAAFAANPSPCADYYVHLPAIAGDKAQPRGGAAVQSVHDAGARFHAMAEFHWGEWSTVGGMTWLEKGREFRARMVAAGYDPTRDTWGINELPSTTRTDPAVRADVEALVQGLYEGPAGSPAMGGAVYVIGMGSGTLNFSVYKPALEGWLEDATFWQTMNKYVRWWGQETYQHPADVCVGSVQVAVRSAAVNDYAMHVAKLAAAGPASAGAARSFFDESYVPLQSAFWHGAPYGTETTTLEQMKHLVSTQVYASRAWGGTHNYPDWRLALAWNDQLDGATPAELDELAARVAAAVRGAYDEGASTAAHACSPSGAYTWCVCDVPGAAFNAGWSTFETW